MKEIFEQGEFNQFSNIELREARSYIREFNAYGKFITTVFISHKHDDLEDLKGVLGFLEKKYRVNVYIDSEDPNMPSETCSRTASEIKDRIRKCQKFILLATNNAIESKWCNWELGYGDALKFRKNIAILPMRPKGSKDIEYKGSEYMGLYPCIVQSDLFGAYCKRGEEFYVRWYENGKLQQITLADWFSER